MAVLPLLHTPGWYLCGIYFFKTKFSDSSDTSASISPNLAASLCALAGRADPIETTARASSAIAKNIGRIAAILAVLAGSFPFDLAVVDDVFLSYDITSAEGSWLASSL